MGGGVGWGCRYKSLDSSAPTILPPRVRIPTAPAIIVKFVLHLFLHCEKNKNKQKEPGLGCYLKILAKVVLLGGPTEQTKYLGRKRLISRDGSIAEWLMQQPL